MWDFVAVHRRAIALLKAAFIKSAVLAFQDHSQEYIIHLDASDSAVRATLSQEDSSGCVKLLTCMSKKLNSAEKNYPTHEREFPALLQALRHWRHYVLGPHVVAYNCMQQSVDADTWLAEYRVDPEFPALFSPVGVFWTRPVCIETGYGGRN